MKYYLGIDGGGTKTTACITDQNGSIILKETGRTINFYAVGMAAARENLKKLMSKLNILHFDGVFIGCSALDRKADECLINKLCNGIIESQKIKMNSDAYIALKSMGDVPCPVVVIAGTGSMAIGENENKDVIISGGWGPILGDEGSAYSIAVSALKECCCMCDKGDKPLLISKAKEYFNIADYRDIIDIIYSPDCSKDYISGFAEIVGNLAEDGDTICKGIITNEAIKLTSTVDILLKKTENCTAVGLYGGVFKNNTLFRNTFAEELKKIHPDITAELLSVPPEESACKLARSL